MTDNITLDSVQKMMKQLTPDQQNIAKTLAAMRVENETMRNRLGKLTTEYDELWKVMIVVCDACPDKELRIHRSQFKRFKDEYRIARSYDKETDEMVLKLKTLTDGN